MKEFYIPNKVKSIMSKLQDEKTLRRIEREKAAAFIANRLSEEIDASTEKFKIHLAVYAHKLVKEYFK